MVTVHSLGYECTWEVAEHSKSQNPFSHAQQPPACIHNLTETKLYEVSVCKKQQPFCTMHHFGLTHAVTFLFAGGTGKLVAMNAVELGTVQQKRQVTTAWFAVFLSPGIHHQSNFLFMLCRSDNFHTKKLVATLRRGTCCNN